MKHVVVTGAGGFIGRRLVTRLLQDGCVGDPSAPIERLTLVDINLPEARADERVTRIEGSLADPEIRLAVVAGGVNCLFHLAAIPGGMAEATPQLGLGLNVSATTALLQELGRQDDPARIVYSSTIAVFGAPLPAQVDDATRPMPSMSYGAQKLMMEVLLADMSRRGTVDARCIRLPGVLARPRVAAGLVSAFMSNMFHDVAAGREIVLPVSAVGTVWVMSVARVIQNLLHAAQLSPDVLPPQRAWTLPALRTSMGELVNAIAASCGQSAALARFVPQPEIEAQFASNPPLMTPIADALGFRADESVEALVKTVFCGLHAHDA